MEVTMINKPEEAYLNVTKMANTLMCNPDIEFGSYELITIPGKDIFTTMDISKDDHIELSNPNISAWDFAVMDAVYTLFQFGNRYINADTIAKTLMGDYGAEVTDKKRKTIAESITKLRSIDIVIDCTAELIMRRKIGENESIVFKGYLLPVEEIRYTDKDNNIAIAYHILEKPALYAYAESVNQKIKVPIKYLNAIHVSNTEETIVLRMYLIRRIAAMKNRNNKMVSKKISYEWYDTKHGTEKGLLSSLGYTPEKYRQWRIKRNDIHKTVIAILQDFIDYGYIKGYEINYQSRNQISGVTIEC